MPLFWVSLAFLCGIVLASRFSIPTLVWCILAVLSVLFTLPPVLRWIKTIVRIKPRGLSEKLRIPSLVFYPLMVAFLCLGAIRYQLSQPHIDPAFIAYYNDLSSEMIIEGIIVEPPDARDTYTNLKVQVVQVQPAGQNQYTLVHGLLLARIPVSVSVNYGDRIRLQGKLQTPPENEEFSYRDYLANHGIYSYLPYPAIEPIQAGQGNLFLSLLYSFRQKAVAVIYSLIPDPEASLVAGIVLGVQTGISSQLQEAFRLTGTSHIIVISGFNITIIAGMFTLIFSRFLGRYKGAVAAAIGIILYTLLVGANPAVVRAALLGLLGVVGHLIGRRQTGLNSLTFAAGIMAVITPQVLWDVSFQLSFAATLGIMLYAEPMTEWFVKTTSRFVSHERVEKLVGPVSEYFLLTLAAQITTLPLMVFYFRRLSLTAFIANPLILPAQPPIMVLGGLAVLAGLIVHPVGQLLAWVAWPFTAYTIRIVEWLSTIPHGSIALGQVALPTLLLLYGVIFSVTFAHDQMRKVITKLTPAIPLSIMAVATVLIWDAAFYARDSKLHVIVLNVGTGEAVLIQTPDGREVLINGGASTNALSEALGRRLPFYDWSLDWWVVADIDNEDLAGVVGNLERFEPRNVLWAGNTSGTRAAGDVWAQIDKLSIPTTTMVAGQALDLGKEARLEVLSVNDKGAVLLLAWGNFRMLLPMGIDVKSLGDLQNSSAMRNISALLLAESGYAPVNPPALIDQLNPQAVLLSVAADDSNGLPSPETIQALAGYNLVRTDRNGWIEITTDGEQIWVEAERR